VTVFWNVALCMVIVLMMEAVNTSETSVNFYEIVRYNIPEDNHQFICLNDRMILWRILKEKAIIDGPF
jgi:hypothetical protein